MGVKTACPVAETDQNSGTLPEYLRFVGLATCSLLDFHPRVLLLLLPVQIPTATTATTTATTTTATTTTTTTTTTTPPPLR